MLLQPLFTRSLMTRALRTANLQLWQPPNYLPVLTWDGMGTMGTIGDMYLRCQSRCEEKAKHQSSVGATAAANEASAFPIRALKLPRAAGGPVNQQMTDDGISGKAG